MLIVYGTRRKIKVAQDMGVQVCPNCGHTSRLALAMEKTIGHIFYIPLFSITSRRMVLCSGCGIVEQLEKDRFKQMTAQFSMNGVQQ